MSRTGQSHRQRGNWWVLGAGVGDGRKEVTPNRYQLLGVIRMFWNWWCLLFKLVHIVKPADTELNGVDFLP